MTFTVLGDSDVKKILATLTPAEVSDLVRALQHALIQYSCKDELQYQPHRAVVSRPDGQVTLFMPASTPQTLGVKIVGISPSKPVPEVSKGAPPPGLKSVLTLCDATGQAIGTLNAAELTAFRTALGSMLLYRLRRNTENITVFGAGKQALWHIRLAILLRGKDIRSITIVNRSASRTQQLVDSLSNNPDSPWPSHIKLEVLSEKGDRDAALADLVVKSDAIFCTTPSTQPLFPASVLTSKEALSKTRYISAIGSYRLDMQEIDPEFLKLVVDPSSQLAASVYQGLITVDSLDGCLHEAGELVKANIPNDKMLEIGKLFQQLDSGSESGLTAWLENGLVVYKSVGVGVMDIAIGQQLMALAKPKNVGLITEDF